MGNKTESDFLKEHIPYKGEQYSTEDMLQRSSEFYQWLDKRRSVRHFSDKPVPRKVIEGLVKAASTAPSGAHKQPWCFCVVGNADIKRKIREAAEEEEYKNYNGRMTDEWLRDLAPLGTDWQKPFLETAPWLVVLFKKSYETDAEGNKYKNYYVSESVGLAAGFFLAAVHNAGLVALTHTPSPMNFLSNILKRPENEKPYLLMPVGFAAENATVPDLQRKKLEEISHFY